ncbi:hypothetical protein L1987_59440 [Smallanthus sonchifolius]|uniref:Uncharacterized protein n=1 Tax=Smallanthus sonchifolius TaxID=185202 RepID=A0ACB9D5L7_9ASTR|nr:hypothetical protein L1987_59440 [Smallanthus sonchifolius]
MEIEAMTAVTLVGLTVYDMCMAASKDIQITDVRLEHKTGGNSGLRSGCRAVEGRGWVGLGIGGEQLGLMVVVVAMGVGPVLVVVVWCLFSLVKASIMSKQRLSGHLNSERDSIISSAAEISLFIHILYRNLLDVLWETISKRQRSVDTQVEEITESSSSPLASSNQTKCCTDCQTTRTPLWRGGPAGPKSLCNACGIKYNKKRRAQMSGLDKNTRKTTKNPKRNGDLLKVRLMVINQNQQQQRKRSSYERGKPWWNKLREEEQAAILLMAISCGGSVYS